MKLTKEQITEIANSIGVDYASLMAFISVESGGQGFDPVTGKITIQFEPKWFKNKAPYSPSGAWSVNGVDRQSQEWIAFNSAFAINPNAAMESTSIGLGQIMGLHYKRLGYKTVGAMWDDAKKGEYEQVKQMAKFIQSDPGLMNALKAKNWNLVACKYNGYGYQELAKKINIVPYNKQMEIQHNKFLTT